MTFARSAGGGASSTKKTQALMLDERNGIIVERFPLTEVVTQENLDSVRPEVDAVMARLDPAAQPGAVVVAGGLPGLEYMLRTPSGARSWYYVLFDGLVEYTLNCQYTREHVPDIQNACRTAHSTLRRV